MTEWSQAQGDAGWHLIHGDALQVLPTLEAGSVDCIICDPPYGTTACKWDAVIPFAPMWDGIKHVIKRNAAVVLFGSQPFTSALVMSNPKWFRHEWVWIKNRGSNFANTNREPMKEHENALVFSEGGWVFNRQMQERAENGASRVMYRFTSASDTRPAILNGQHFARRVDASALRVPSSWQKFNTEVGLHPTQKPVALLEYLIRTYTNEGETVLDFTMGSGSTGVAALNTGRRFIGIEKDAGYFAIAQDRLEAASQQLRMAV